MSLTSSVEAFRKGLSFTDWADHLSYSLDANCVTNDKIKKAHLMNLCGPFLFTQMKHLFSPEALAKVTFDEIVTKLKQSLNKTEPDLVHRLRFSQLVQQSDETAEEFVEMVKLHAEFCDFGIFKDVAIQDRILAGLNDKNLKQMLLNEGNLTVSSMEKFIRSWVAAKLNFKSLTGKPNNKFYSGSQMHQEFYQLYFSNQNNYPQMRRNYTQTQSREGNSRKIQLYNANMQHNTRHNNNHNFEYNHINFIQTQSKHLRFNDQTQQRINDGDSYGRRFKTSDTFCDFCKQMGHSKQNCLKCNSINKYFADLVNIEAGVINCNGNGSNNQIIEECMKKITTTETKSAAKADEDGKTAIIDKNDLTQNGKFHDTAKAQNNMQIDFMIDDLNLSVLFNQNWDDFENDDLCQGVLFNVKQSSNEQLCTTYYTEKCDESAKSCDDFSYFENNVDDFDLENLFFDENVMLSSNEQKSKYIDMFDDAPNRNDDLNMLFKIDDGVDILKANSDNDAGSSELKIDRYTVKNYKNLKANADVVTNFAPDWVDSVKKQILFFDDVSDNSAKVLFDMCSIEHKNEKIKTILNLNCFGQICWMLMIIICVKLFIIRIKIIEISVALCKLLRMFLTSNAKLQKWVAMSKGWTINVDNCFALMSNQYDWKLDDDSCLSNDNGSLLRAYQSRILKLVHVIYAIVTKTIWNNWYQNFNEITESSYLHLVVNIKINVLISSTIGLTHKVDECFVKVEKLLFTWRVICSMYFSLNFVQEQSQMTNGEFQDFIIQFVLIFGVSFNYDDGHLSTINTKIYEWLKAWTQEKFNYFQMKTLLGDQLVWQMILKLNLFCSRWQIFERVKKRVISSTFFKLSNSLEKCFLKLVNIMQIKKNMMIKAMIVDDNCAKCSMFDQVSIKLFCILTIVWITVHHLKINSIVCIIKLILFDIYLKQKPCFHQSQRRCGASGSTLEQLVSKDKEPNIGFTSKVRVKKPSNPELKTIAGYSLRGVVPWEIPEDIKAGFCFESGHAFEAKLLERDMLHTKNVLIKSDFGYVIRSGISSKSRNRIFPVDISILARLLS